MSPVEFWRLSSAISIAGAAGIVLLTTNIIAVVAEYLVYWTPPTQLRARLGVIIAVLLTGLATWFSPPAPGNMLGLLLQFSAVSILLYTTAFGGSRVAVRAFAREVAISDKHAMFWRPW